MRLRLLLLICMLPGVVLPIRGMTLPVDEVMVCDAGSSSHGWTMLPPSRTLELLGTGSISLEFSPAHFSHVVSTSVMRANPLGPAQTLQSRHMRLQV